MRILVAGLALMVAVSATRPADAHNDFTNYVSACLNGEVLKPTDPDPAVGLPMYRVRITNTCGIDVVVQMCRQPLGATDDTYRPFWRRVTLEQGESHEWPDPAARNYVFLPLGCKRGARCGESLSNHHPHCPE